MLEATVQRRVLVKFHEPDTEPFHRYGSDEDPIVSQGETFTPHLAIGWGSCTATGNVQPDALDFTARADIAPLDRVVGWETMPPVDVRVWSIDLLAPDVRVHHFTGRIKTPEEVKGEDPDRWKFKCESTKRMLKRSLGQRATEFSPYQLSHHFLRASPEALAPRACALTAVRVDDQPVRCKLDFPAGEDLTPELWRGGYVKRGGLALMILGIEPDGTVELESPIPSAWLSVPGEPIKTVNAYRGHDGRITSLEVHGLARYHSAIGIAMPTRSPTRTP